MTDSIVQRVEPLGFPWTTRDPFLFCVHHHDDYPAGNERLGPATSLAGRHIGMDFGGKDGWSMYHGDVVPGFPRHPHRGFETVTLARNGYIDHSDSLGATARFGHGDVQWMTAGRGVVHCEMFPLVKREAGNPTELFQIWLNLPRSHKMVDPYFTMFWSHTIPRLTLRDDAGRGAEIAVVAGTLLDAKGPPPPPDSWASQPGSDVAIWTLRLEAGARLTLPAAPAGVHRTLYFFVGNTLRIADRDVRVGQAVHVRPDVDLALSDGDAFSEVLMLQGRPIAEPVAQHGPFVMNTPAELRQAYVDYQETGFGGWPWDRDDPVHARQQGRFALHADGRREEPGQKGT